MCPQLFLVNWVYVSVKKCVCVVLTAVVTEVPDIKLKQ